MFAFSSSVYPGSRMTLHAVEQRRRDVERVRSADEHHLGEIEVDFQVVVAERRVLLGIEHFEQRRGRVPAEIHRHLVDFVQQVQRIADPGPRHVLHDLAGHRADVGAAVAADLRLVTHTAERHADELAVGRPRDALSEGRLADAGRPNEAQDGPFSVWTRCWTARYSTIRSFTLSRPKWSSFSTRSAAAMSCLTLVRFFHGTFTSQSM
jgi:hypothetical protein